MYRAVVALGIFVFALNLRAAVVSIAPLLHQIQVDLHLSGGEAGLLTTLPVVCFGVFSPLAPLLARSVGIERTLFGSTLLLIAAFALRLVPATWALYGGTLVAGIAIALGNVLVPALIKRDFAAKSAAITAGYITSLSCGPALAAGLTVPLQRALGLDWRSALCMWIVLPLVTAIVWLPQLRSVHRIAAGPRISLGMLLRSRTAWSVTLFMGLQSVGFYTTTAWLPTFYVAHGLDAAAAGGLLSLSGIVGIPVVLLVPLISLRLRDQRPLVWTMGVLYATALLGIMADPIPLAVATMCILGIAQAMTISLAITFIVARSPDGAHAAQLSSMSQGIGYIMAACGPFLFGVARDASGAYLLPLAGLVVLVVPMVGAGVAAARPDRAGLTAAASAIH